MNFLTKTQLIILAAALVIGFVAGSLTHPSKEVKTTSNEKINLDIKSDKDIHEHTVTIITKTPDGVSTTRIDNTQDTVSVTNTDKRSSLVTTSDTVRGKKSINLSALVGVSVYEPLIPIYGISVTKPIFGPITAGVFGLSTGTIGVSIGCDF